MGSWLTKLRATRKGKRKERQKKKVTTTVVCVSSSLRATTRTEPRYPYPDTLPTQRLLLQNNFKVESFHQNKNDSVPISLYLSPTPAIYIDLSPWMKTDCFASTGRVCRPQPSAPLVSTCLVLSMRLDSTLFLTRHCFLRMPTVP